GAHAATAIICACMSVGKAGYGAVRSANDASGARRSMRIVSAVTVTLEPASRTLVSTASSVPASVPVNVASPPAAVTAARKVPVSMRSGMIACVVPESVATLSGTTHAIMPDRIETGTFLAAVTAAGGEATLTGTEAGTLDAVLTKVREAGSSVTVTADTIRIERRAPLASFALRTAPYPAFPTDMQAQMMAVAACAPGTTTVTETIFENRMMHVQELVRLGADIEVEGSTAIVRGVPKLTGADVMATDLRA